MANEVLRFGTAAVAGPPVLDDEGMVLAVRLPVSVSDLMELGRWFERLAVLRMRRGLILQRGDWMVYEWEKPEVPDGADKD